MSGIAMNSGRVPAGAVPRRGPDLDAKPRGSVGNSKPPARIRGLLILIGVAPTAYALNRALPESSTPGFMRATERVEGVFTARAHNQAVPADRARDRVTQAVQEKSFDKPTVFAALC